MKKESAPRCFICPNYRLAEKVRPIAQTIVIQQKKNNQGYPGNAMPLRISQHEDHGSWGDTQHLGSSVKAGRSHRKVVGDTDLDRIPPYVVRFRQPDI